MKTIEIIKNFQTDDACIEYLNNIRWAKMKQCPYCYSTNISKHIEKGRRSRLQCSNCKTSFSPTVNTIMHGTKIPLFKWFLAISLLAEAKKSMSNRQLGRHLDLPVKTSYSLAQRIRKALLGSRSPLLQGIIELDETYIGGKPRYPNTGAKRGRGTKKTIVVGALQRGGNVIAEVPNKYKGKEARNFVVENVDLENSLLYSDEYSIYAQMNKLAQHETVNHGNKEYARGNVHTNSIEGYWALVKRAWYGQHHHYSKKFTPLYIAEASFKYNNRYETTATAFSKIVKQLTLCTPS